jgi:hypothetical protein
VKHFIEECAGSVSDNGSDISDDLMNLALTEVKCIPEEVKSVPEETSSVSAKLTSDGFFSGFDLDADLEDEDFIL